MKGKKDGNGKRRISKLAGLGLLLLLMSLWSITAFAITIVPISTDNAWVAGTISTGGEVDFYSVTLPSDGWLTVVYQGLSIGYSRIYLLSYDQTKEYSYYRVNYSSDTNPQTRSDSYALEKGTYVIKIQGNYSATGDYRLKTSFKAANNNEAVSNDTFQTAQRLSLGQTVTGFISLDDQLDFYRIDLSATTKVRIRFTTYIHNTAYFQVWNGDLVSIHTERVYYASETDPKIFVYEETLSPGTYYFKVYPYYSSTGRYQINYSVTELVKSITISGNKRVVAGNSFNLTSTVYPTTASNTSVTWSSGDTNIATVSSSGMVTTKRPGVVYITCQAQDGSNITRTVMVIVLPTKMTIYGYKKSSRKTYLYWSSQYGVTGYQIQYSASSSMKNAKTKRLSSSKTNVTIKKLSSKKYYFRIRAYVKVGGKYYYGKWSSKKRITLR